MISREHVHGFASVRAVWFRLRTNSHAKQYTEYMIVVEHQEQDCLHARKACGFVNFGCSAARDTNMRAL